MSLYDKYHSQQNKNYMYELIANIVKKEYDSDPTQIKSYNDAYESNFKNAFHKINTDDIKEVNKELLDTQVNYFVSNLYDRDKIFTEDNSANSKNLKDSDYDFVKANLKINNFITSFEFLEEDDHLNDSSYVINRSKYKFNNNYSLNFSTSKNLDKNITDYYNLIYEYENDCLTAAI